MSNGRTLAPQRPELVTGGPAPARPRWFEMVMSSDHKDVGRVYIGAALSFLVLGIVSFLLIRLQLGVPENNLIEPVTFNRLLSVGSATLIVLFALPLAFGLYTYVVPLQIGARSLAFPRLASLSVWLFVLGGGLLYVSFVYTPPEAGFNSWPPLSDTVFISNNGVDVWIAAVGLTVLYVLGRELQDVFPVAFLPENHALAIAIMSYHGGIDFGLLGDYDTMEDIEMLATGLSESLSDLLAAAEAAESRTQANLAAGADLPG